MQEAGCMSELQSSPGGWLAPSHAELLARAREVAEGVLAPAAAATDQAEQVPRTHLDRLAAAGLLGIAVPAEYGGAGAPGSVLREYLAILAAACGTTTFVQMQHVSAGGLIAGGENENLKREILPRLAAGERWCSLAFSHVRRPGAPLVRATRDAAGFRFDGEAPWMTGWGLMDEVVLAGTLPGGDYVFVVAPLAESGALQASPPLRLCGMNATTTVALTCRGLWVGEERWVKTITPAAMAESDRAGALTPTALSLGAARAAQGLVARQAETHDSRPLADTAAGLAGAIEAARAEVDGWEGRVADPDYPENAMRCRARCVELGVRAAYTAIIASGGSANLLAHPAQRLYREAMVYSLLAQTRDVQAATLARLAERDARA
jgi:alkylation response protein AidB-like acyl-CoA dehydrogenase